MSRIATFIVGRQSSCDYVIDDKSVSRQHAEVNLLDDGRFFVTDRASSSGTAVLRRGAWVGIRQEMVDPGTRIRFGNHEMPVELLEKLRTPNQDGGWPSATAAGSGGQPLAIPETPEIDVRKGLKRDPTTGEVIEK